MSYVSVPQNYSSYKVFVSKANGSGKFGEALTDPFVAPPNLGHTQTFASIGNFSSEDEANACANYIRTKFLRALLGSRKVTQDIPAYVWEEIPLQDFTTNSDIDWSKSIADIDQQLYKKYGLSDEEIEFIETHVKEMV